VVSIPTADWLLGGTGGTLWILLLAGESFLLSGGSTPLIPENASLEKLTPAA
jgi:hypothetical protein